MWIWIVSNVAGALLGAATTKWFKDTRAGVWCYDRFDDIANWAGKRYGIDILDKEGTAWKTKYPNVSNEIELLRRDVDKLSKKVEEMLK